MNVNKKLRKIQRELAETELNSHKRESTIARRNAMNVNKKLRKIQRELAEVEFEMETARSPMDITAVHDTKSIKKMRGEMLRIISAFTKFTTHLNKRQSKEEKNLDSALRKYYGKLLDILEG